MVKDLQSKHLKILKEDWELLITQKKLSIHAQGTDLLENMLTKAGNGYITELKFSLLEVDFLLP